jgi:predicted AlkP superfamily pyrophosphatase or phosphodiesterase
MHPRIIWCVILAVSTAASAQTNRPDPQIRHVVIISVDGLRPDLALRADTPNIHALFNSGSFSFWAKTTAESVTLPSHTSMLTGVVPVKHGIQWNSDLPLTRAIYPNFPTIFELARQCGYTTAMAAGKSKFVILAKPGSLNWEFIPYMEKIQDYEVADQAAAMILLHQPDLLFVHLPGVDTAGHAFGWSSREQMQAIAQADAAIGNVLWALDQAHLRDSTFILVTSDHGGSGRMHGPDDDRSRHIPWIAVGPGIRRGLDLTIYGDLVINTEDTFATVAYLMGIPVMRQIDGKPVMEILDRSNADLLQPSK